MHTTIRHHLKIRAKDGIRIMGKDKAKGGRTGAHLDLCGPEAKVKAKEKVHVIHVVNTDMSQGFAPIWFNHHRNS